MAVSKGLQTRDRILDTAFRLAARDGLEGLSLSALATELGLSKSGLFAHFRSKEDLQMEMLQTGADKFVESGMLQSGAEKCGEAVRVPAFREPRGLPRLNALFERWIRWATDPDLPGGCIFVAAASALDDREGRVRELGGARERRLLETIARAAALCVETGHFRRDLDVEQFAFEFMGVYLVFHQARRLLRDPRAASRARKAYARMVESARSLS